MKTCITCKQQKEKEDFPIASAMADGRANRCKACERKRVNDRSARKRAERERYRVQ